MVKRLWLAVFLAILCPILNAQDLQLFPNIVVKNSPYIPAITECSDGGYLIAGTVDHINGELTSHVSKIDNQGNLVSSFARIVVDGNISKVQELSDGKILLCGWFKKINGRSTSGLARLNPDGTIDETFQMMVFPSNEYLNSFLVQPSGKIVVVGYFHLVDYSKVARLNANGTLDETFQAVNLGITSFPTKILNDSNDNLVIAAGNQVKKVGADGQTISGWTDVAVGQHESFFAIDVHDDKIFIGGSFDSVANVPRTNFAVINADGTINDLAISVLNYVEQLEVCDDGRILINDLNNIMLFDAQGGYQGPIANSLRMFFVDSQSRVFITGTHLLTVQGLSHPFGARLNADLTVDETFHCQPSSSDGIGSAIAADGEGRILIGAYPTALGIGVDNKEMVRILPSGDIDPAFNAMLPVNENAQNVFVQDDGNILVCTGYTILRLLPDGSADANFEVTSIAQPQFFNDLTVFGGKIYAGGYFSDIDGFGTEAIIRFNENGAIDNTFSSGLPVGSYVLDIEFQSDGKIIVTGGFPFNDETKCVVRLNSDGSIDGSFVQGATAFLASQDVEVDEEDRIYFVGGFENYNGSGRARFVRLHPGGTLDLSFQPAVTVSDPQTVTLMAQRELVVGSRTAYGAGLVVYDTAGNQLPSAFDNVACSVQGVFSNDTILYLSGRFATYEPFIVSSVATYQRQSDATITNLSVVFNEDSVASLSWTSDASAATHFVIERSTSSSTAGFIAIDTVTASTFSFQDLTASTDGYYYYRIKPTNFSSEGNYSNTVLLLGLLPALPASEIGTTSFTANWTTLPIAESYLVQLSTDNFVTVDAEFLSSGSGISITGLSGGTDYWYRVQYHVGDEASLFSNAILVVTISSAPINVVATAISQVELMIEWENAMPMPAFVAIERSTDLNEPFVEIARVEGTVTSIIDSGATAETTYYYRLKSITDESESPYSETVSATTLAKMMQSITFQKVGGKIYGNANFALSATASSGLDVTFTSSNPDILSIEGTEAVIHHAGEVTITVSQSGNEKFEPSATSQSLEIGKALQTINFNEIADKHSQEGPFPIVASASSGLPVEFTSSDESIVELTGNIVTILQPGEVTITALQPGNNDYHSTTMSRSFVIHLVTGPENNTISSSVEVFPNPGNGLFTVTLPPATKFQSSLYHLNGEITDAELNRNGNQLLLDIRYLPNGLYLLELKTSSRTDRIKIVKH